MTKEEYGDFVLRYKGCGACFPMYHTLSRFEKMWFSAIQKDVAELEAQIEKMKNCKNCANYMISGKCPGFYKTGWCKNWEMTKGVRI